MQSGLGNIFRTPDQIHSDFIARIRHSATMTIAVLRMQILSVMRITSMKSICSMSQGLQSIHQIELMALLQTESLDLLQTYR